MDLEKAFDKVVHSKLFYKLHRVGFRGNALELLVDFLTGRFQAVRVNNEFSDQSPVLSGIPQGTLLGPLMFILFINDLSNIISDHTSLTIYADDSKIYKKCITLEDCLRLCDDIENTNEWFKSW